MFDELVNEAKKLKAEPNGVNLLRLLGNIYSTKAASHLQSAWYLGFGNPFEGVKDSFLVNIFASYFIAQGKRGPLDNDKVCCCFFIIAVSLRDSDHDFFFFFFLI